MKLRKLWVRILAFVLLTGQAVYAQEIEREIGSKEEKAKEIELTEGTEKGEQECELAEIENSEEMEEVVKEELQSAEYSEMTDEEKWELADIKDLVVKRGQKVKIPGTSDLLEGIKVTEISNQGVLVQQDDRLSNTFHQYYYHAVESGEAILEVSYKNFNKQIVITVTGKWEEYPVGIPMTDSVEVIWLGDKGMGVLSASGELWTLESKFEKIASNIKEIGWGGELILKKNGDLLTGYSENDCIAHDVVDIAQHRMDDLWYVLKKDGTLWIYGERVPDIKGGDDKFQQLDTDVKSIALHGYMKNDGTVKTFAVVVAKNAEYLNDVGYYVENEGFHFCGENVPQSYSVYDLQVKDITWMGGHFDEVEDVLFDAVLTMDGEVWAFLIDEPDAAPVRLGGNAERLLDGASADWVDKEGNYYKYNRKLEVSETNPVHLESWGSVQGTDVDLALYGDGKGGYFLKNGAKMLDYVKEILYMTEDEPKSAFVLRTDGTVWCIGDIPVMLGSVASGYKKGDVNEDGEINIKDLQIILRGVCEKIELTERQRMIADVVEDGEVDIQDLRKELRFVCGKIEEL